jgi:hypothetical protein
MHTNEHLRGNKFWKLRTKHGTDRIFGDAALLWEEASKYFDWCDRNPRYKVEIVKYKDGYEEAELPKGRAYTMLGLTLFLGVSEAYFRRAFADLREKEEKGTASAAELELLNTIERICQVIKTDQIEGAAVGLYSSGIISRLNGLSDNMNVHSTQPIVRVTVRDAEAERYLKELEDLL